MAESAPAHIESLDAPHRVAFEHACQAWGGDDHRLAWTLRSPLGQSFNTVRAATHQPGPQVSVSRNGEDDKVQMWTWQEEKDLALLILQKPNQPRMNWSDDTPPAKTGDDHRSGSTRPICASGALR